MGWLVGSYCVFYSYLYGMDLMKDRFVKGGYLLWVVVQLVSLMVFPETFKNVGGMFHQHLRTEFFPFTSSYVGWYDITEFLFYIIVPVLIYYAIGFLRPQPEEPPKEDE